MQREVAPASKIESAQRNKKKVLLFVMESTCNHKMLYLKCSYYTAYHIFVENQRLVKEKKKFSLWKCGEVSAIIWQRQQFRRFG